MDERRDGATTATKNRTEDFVDLHLNDMSLVEADDLVSQFVPKWVRFEPYVLVHRMRSYCINHIRTVYIDRQRMNRNTICEIKNVVDI